MIIRFEKVLPWVIFGLSVLFMRSMFVVFDLPDSTVKELTQQGTVFQEDRDETALLFLGDIMLSRSVAAKTVAAGDYKHPFLEAVDTLREADLVFGNLEGPISSRGKNQGSIYSFRADPQMVEGLTYAGIDGLSLANNHIWDWGRDALIDTVSILDEVGIKSVGAGANYEEANKPALFEVGKAKIAVLAYTDLLPQSMEALAETPGLSDFDLDAIKTTINILVKEGNLVVVSLHWGDEYEVLANASQREMARSLIDAGASLIVGHHPHVVQELEQYGNGWVAYSLGNFIFDQSFSKETMEGAALKVRLERGKIVDVRLAPITISSDFQPNFEPQEG